MVRRQADFAALKRDQWMSRQRSGNSGRESIPVDCERPACRHLVCVGSAHDQRAKPAHFLMQNADRIVFAIIGAE
jgi:hypothetical protein